MKGQFRYFAQIEEFQKIKVKNIFRILALWLKFNGNQNFKLNVWQDNEFWGLNCKKVETGNENFTVWEISL